MAMLVSSAERAEGVWNHSKVKMAKLHCKTAGRCLCQVWSEGWDSQSIKITKFTMQKVLAHACVFVKSSGGRKEVEGDFCTKLF